uniref:Uncharacterized protein n=1 Tax=Leersia perrieri TaxID=77586 RepID=A0A0D9X5Z0_9ORYZ
MALAPFLPTELVVSSLTMIVLVCLYKAYWRPKYRYLYPVDWPTIGLLPSLVGNRNRLHDHVTDVLAGAGQSYTAHGLGTAGMRFFITCDPDNVRHIFTTNHDNYPKGHEFAEIFDIMAGIFFTMDGEECSRQRAKAQSILSDPRLVASIASRCHDKVKDGLLPFLAKKPVVEMQDLSTRFMFDVTAMAVFGVDPGCLSPDMPSMHVSVAMDTIMEVGLFRHTVPAPLWKAMRWFKIGPEGKLDMAHTGLHGFITQMMEQKAMTRKATPTPSMDILSSYIDDPDYTGLMHSLLITYMVAGRDTIGTTLPWFFYNLAMKPHVVSAIRDELAPIAAARKDDDMTMMTFSPEDTKPLVYLQAALLETLRLYPPGWIERKTVVANDVMPSGHEVRAGDTVLISAYSMGRMESLWGKDCYEYRPERWLYDDDDDIGGGARKKKRLRYVASHKFLAFNSGPRMCLGKHIAIMQMKTVAAAVVWNFDVEVVEGHTVEPKLSCLLQMKNGVMLKVNKRALIGHQLVTMALAPFLPTELVVSSLIIIVLVFQYIAYWRSKYKYLYPVEWPMLGLLIPFLVANRNRLHDYVTDAGQSITAHGLATNGMRKPVVVMQDLAMRFMFDVMAMAVKDGLLPFLAKKPVVEMQDLATRFMFDVTAMVVFGVVPGCLSLDMPLMHVLIAMDTIMEVGLFRHTVPAPLWKVMRRFKIGPEGKLDMAHTGLRGFITQMMEQKAMTRKATPTLSMHIFSS